MGNQKGQVGVGCAKASEVIIAIQKAIAEVVANKLHNPNLDGLIISIIDVDTAPDLSLAKVSVSVLSTDEVKNLVISELNKAKGFIRREVMRMVRLKATPELSFMVDNSYEKGQKIMNLIEKVSTGNKE